MSEHEVVDDKLCSSKCVFLKDRKTRLACLRYNERLVLNASVPDRTEKCMQRSDGPTERLHDWYASYIERAMLFAEREAGVSWPTSTRIITKSYSSLAAFKSVGEMKILICDMPSSFEFFVAVPSKRSDNRKLQKAFLEYLELYPFIPADDASV